jgi:endonuclease-8
MEGPSLYLAQQQLRPFARKTVLEVSGNTKIGKERLHGQRVREIFAWGKHLVFQLEGFAMRIHFMLFGSFEAEIDGKWVTGDYRRSREPRLELRFDNGVFKAYSCSIRFIEERRAKSSYDFSRDIMSPKWNAAAARRRVREQPDVQIADVLLDQDLFAGVGNIIKNEVLSIVRVSPKRKVKDIPPKQLARLIEETRAFSKQFYRWRKRFVLRKNLKAHRRARCPHCDAKLMREKTGKRQRWAYWCRSCQR